ncbi:MAG: signal peptidase II [Nitrospirae bacterium]|nr:signal peptidase II [Nitrospirota bacterium]
MLKNPKWLFAGIISASVIILDYITKQAIVEYVTPYESIDLIPFLRIVHVRNPGAAFGLFSGLSNYVFIAIYLAAMSLIIIYALKSLHGLELFASALIIGGATGNLIDRLTVGKVIDFIDFFISDWHWPAFNVADSALTVGIIIFLIANLSAGKHTDKLKNEK